MKKNTLKNSWWLNLPSIMALTVIIIKVISIFPDLPDRVPMQFDFTGKPTTWGTPAGLLAAMLLPLLSLVVFNSVMYMVYSGYETKKKYGWYFLVMPFLTGFYTVLAWSHLDFAAAGSGYFRLPLGIALLVSFFLTLNAAVIEWYRPVMAHPENTTEQKEQYLSRWRNHFTNHRQSGRFLYFESQNPAWFKYVITGLILVFMITSFFIRKPAPANAITFWVLTPIFATFYGGLRFVVDNRSVRVRLGILRLTLCKIKIADIAAVSVHSFSPLTEFGGWGIRMSINGTLGFFFSGTTGVLIKTKTGRKYLLGSDNPSRFAAFIESLL
jgi:hypothetical protein